MKALLCTVRVLAAAFLLVVVFQARVWAQATAQIHGTVADSTGAVIAGAQVTATNTGTGVMRTVTTEGTGTFVLSNLQPGSYTVGVTAMGFNKFVQTGITLAVGDNPEVPVVMKPGSVTQEVEVTSNAQIVETQTQGFSNVVESQRISDLPLNGRNTVDLIQLAGAAVPGGTAGNASTRGFQGSQGGVGFSIAGSLTGGVTYLLDGAEHNDAYDNLNMPLPFPDALQEFRLETSGLTAKYGLHGGGTVSAVTKSGTNDWHGDAFEFLRNFRLDARNPFSPVVNGSALTDGLKRNQYGGTAGGPIKKNKLFVFGGIQFTDTRQTPPATQEFVPTPAELAGNFATEASATCQSKAVTLKAPFGAGNIVPVGDLDPAALKISNLVLSQLTKAGITPNQCGSINYVSPVAENEYQAVGRGDYHLSDQNSLFMRYIATHDNYTSPNAISPLALTSINGGHQNLAQSAAVGETYLISPTIVNSASLAFDRISIHRLCNPYFQASDEGINEYTFIPGLFQMTMTGGFNLGSGVACSSFNKTDQLMLTDDINIVKGNHQFSFGGNLGHWETSFVANVASVGGFSFTGATTGLGLADFLTGQLDSFNQALPNSSYPAQYLVGAYAQDSWRVTPRLTLNYGLRWEPWFPQIINNGAIGEFDPTRFAEGITSNVYAGAPPGVYWPGDPGYIGKSGQQKDAGIFSPRIGFAWDMFGDGKTSLRGSYGMFHDFADGDYLIWVTYSPPFSDSITINPCAAGAVCAPGQGFDNPWGTYGATAVSAAGTSPFPAASTKAIFPSYSQYESPSSSNLPPTVIHEWNLSLQRQLGTNWVISANYLGNDAVRLWDTMGENNGVYVAGTCTKGGFFPAASANGNPNVPDGVAATGACTTSANLNNRRALNFVSSAGSAFSGLDLIQTNGYANYNGLLLQVQHRLSNGFVINANYTWSHNIGITSEESTLAPVGTSYQFPSNVNLDRGPEPLDHRSIFNVSTSYTTPPVGSALVRKLEGGWTVGAIYSFYTGDPLTVTTGVDQNGSGVTGNQRASQVLADPYGGGRTVDYLNPAAFAEPCGSTTVVCGQSGHAYGVAACNPYATVAASGCAQIGSVRGPSISNLDVALYRTFKLTERFNLNIRGEAFNAFNNFEPGDPTLTLNSTLFGNITAYAGGNDVGHTPRQLQLSAKLNF